MSKIQLEWRGKYFSPPQKKERVCNGVSCQQRVLLRVREKLQECIGGRPITKNKKSSRTNNLSEEIPAEMI